MDQLIVMGISNDFFTDLGDFWALWYVGWGIIITGIIVVLLVVLLLWIVWGFILRRIKDNISPHQHGTLRTLGRASIFLLGIFWILGVEVFLSVALLFGAAIGFASTTTIGNFISGLYLLITNPFSVGDYIIIPDKKVEGVVEEISINFTKLLSPQGIHVSITNLKMLGMTIHNTRITVPQDAVDKGKITWKDNDGDTFDSVDDVVDILKGIRTRFADKENEFFLYPLHFKLNPDKYKHSLTKKVFEEALSLKLYTKDELINEVDK